MKLIAIVVAGSLGLAGALWPQEPPRRVSDNGRARFLFHGIFEGLVEDGVQAEIVERVLARRDEWFVPKCPICNAVHAAFQAYASYARDHGWRSPRTDGLPPWFGLGLPADTVEALKSGVVKLRHGALEKLVQRYIAQRFSRLKMTDAEAESMRIALKLGMKEGLGFLKDSGGEELFPSSCPSCEGAN
jgi:hypothetical protein